MILKELLETVSKIRYEERFKNLNNNPPFEVWYDNFLSSLEYLWINSTDSICGREIHIKMDKSKGNYTLLGYQLALEQEVPTGYWLYIMSGRTGEFSLEHKDSEEEILNQIEEYEKQGILTADQVSEIIAIKDNHLIKYIIAE